ncbi:MAG: hypothetical protein EAZ61_08855 [Oscillatoriales cyanobacterium]|nr:MAG: hypothetical protein EAZ61_08855 [Oscillatoriales cyanobacterium]
MSLNSTVSFFTLFHTITRVFWGEPVIPAQVARTSTPQNILHPITLAEPFTDFWFGSPDAPGVIAIGMAEGTRTLDGVRTTAWYGHTDPGNSRYNVGTFSHQHTDLSPAQADELELKILRAKLAVLIQAQPHLSTLEYLAAADLSIQAQGAFPVFTHHLETVRERNLKPVATIVEARVRSFYNPINGHLEAAGFNNDVTALRRDQLRRTRVIERKVRDIKLNTPEAMTIANRP